MSTTRIRGVIVAALTSAVVFSGALAGCSISKDDEPERSSQPSTPEPTPSTQSDEPSPTPTQATATPSPTPSATPPPTEAGTPAGALLSAAELPQLNETSPWAEGRTGTASERPFGLCQKFDLLSVGAMSAIERTYTSGKDTAGELVAEFPDAQNTVRASKVIEAWQRDCKSQLEGAANVTVGGFADVAVPRGKGSWYLVSFERRGSGHFHSLGLVVSGSRMALIRMDHAGQDHNYEAGKDPMELALKAVSARLG
jgi:hypothetical protein